jgi:ABC-type glycerol-3-phosphate transport system substrate-binding protein
MFQIFIRSSHRKEVKMVKTTARCWLLVFLVVLLIGNVYAAGTEEGAQQKGELGTITLWMGSWWEDALPAIVTRAEAENPGLKVNAETQPIAGYNDKAIAAMLSPNPPDVLATHLTLHFPGYVSAGVLEPLQPWVDRSKVLDPDNWFQADWKDGIFNGTLYSISYRGGISALHYNAGLFRDVGLDPEKPPAVRDSELLDAAKKLTYETPDGVYGYGMPATSRNDHIVADSLMAIVAFGGDWANESKTKCTLNSPASVKGVTWWSELHTKYEVVPPSLFDNTHSEVGRLLGAGKLGMIIAGGYARGYVQDTATPDLDYRISPDPVDGISFGGGWGFSIPKNSKHKEAAWTFIEWFTSPEIHPEVMIREPTTKGALLSPKWGENPDWKPFIQAASRTERKVTVPVHEKTSDIMLIMTEQLQNVLLKRTTPQEAMDAAAKQIDQLLK